MYGRIVRLNSREVNTKRGKSQAYSVLIGLADGTEQWVGLGFKKPDGVVEGDYANLEVYKNQGNYDTADSIDKAQPPATQAVAVGAASAPAKQGYVDRNDSIVYQSSRKDAIALLGLLISQNALPISAAKTAAGVAKRFQEITALVDKLTVEFYYDVSTLRVLEEVEDAGDIEEFAGSLPSEDAEEGDGGSEAWGDES